MVVAVHMVLKSFVFMKCRCSLQTTKACNYPVLRYFNSVYIITHLFLTVLFCITLYFVPRFLSGTSHGIFQQSISQDLQGSGCLFGHLDPWRWDRYATQLHHGESLKSHTVCCNFLCCFSHLNNVMERVQIINVFLFVM